MPDLEISGLDDRIRDLVARAVADAPPAPTIDEHTLEESAMLRPNTQSPSDRNRWIVGGIAGLSVAAAVIALIFVTRPDDPDDHRPGHAADDVRPGDGAGHDAHADPHLGTGDRTAADDRTGACRLRRPSRPPGDHGRPGAVHPGGRRDRSPSRPSTAIQLDTGDAVTDALVGSPAQTAHRVPDGRIFFQRRSLDPPGIFVYFNSDTAVTSAAAARRLHRSARAARRGGRER